MPHFRRKVRRLRGKELTEEQQLEVEEEERAQFRDNENLKAMFSRCEELTPEMLFDEDRLDRGDFVIARVVWKRITNEDEQKHHDHWAIINERKEDGLDVLFITDITKNGERATEYFWEFSLLETQMEKGKLIFLRFNLLDVQDPDAIVIERAKSYMHSTENPRAIHFAYQSIFGTKEPVYSDYHLSLCDPKTLLIVRSDTNQKVLLLQDVITDDDGWKFAITFEDDDHETIEMVTYHQILYMIDGNDQSLFYFPGVEIESLQSLMEAQRDVLKHETAHATVETIGIHVAEKALEKALAHAFGHAFGHAAAHVGGVALHGAIATGIASHKTVMNRRKERLFEKTGGLSGFSRTKANKEVTKDWSAATAGTGAAIGATMGGAAIGTMLLPGVGTVVGGVVGGVVGSLTGGTLGKKVSGEIFDLRIRKKCKLC